MTRWMCPSTSSLPIKSSSTISCVFFIFKRSSKRILNTFLSFKRSSGDTWKKSKASSFIFDFDTFPQLFSFFYQSTALPFVWTLGASITASKFNWRLPEHSNQKDNRAFTFHKKIGGFQTSNNSAILTRQSGGICHQLQISEVVGFFTSWDNFRPSGEIFRHLEVLPTKWWEILPCGEISHHTP